MKAATCSLCRHPINFDDRASYVFSGHTKVYYCSAFTECDVRRGVLKPKAAA